MSTLITYRNGQPYDWQYEIISRIERDGGDPGDPETWNRCAAEVVVDEEAAFPCATCGGTGWMTLSEYPAAAGEHTQARCIDCGANFQ